MQMYNVTKFFKILGINLIIFLILLSISEFAIYQAHKHEIQAVTKMRSKMNKINGVYSSPIANYDIKIKKFSYERDKQLFRKPEGLNYKKRPIIIFGCSLAYGDGLHSNETISYKLSQLTKRPVYNRAYQGWGMQHVLYQLRRADFYKEVPDAEYIIYVMFDEHLQRLFKYQYPIPYNYILLRYKLENNHFKEIHPLLKPLWGLYTVNEIQRYIENNIIVSEENLYKNQDYLFRMMKEIKSLSDKHYPNSKFVILYYRMPSYKMGSENFIDKNGLAQRLKNQGFIIIDSNDITPKDILTNKKYKTIDGWHPSASAWDMLLPKVIKKLNL